MCDERWKLGRKYGVVWERRNGHKNGRERRRNGQSEKNR